MYLSIYHHEYFITLREFTSTFSFTTIHNVQCHFKRIILVSLHYRKRYKNKILFVGYVQYSLVRCCKKSQYYKVCMMSMCKHEDIYILAYTACKLCSKESGIPQINPTTRHNKVSLGNMVTCWRVLCSHSLSTFSTVHWIVKSPFYKWKMEHYIFNIDT